MFKADNPTTSIGLQFWRLYTKWNAKITQNLKPLELTHTQFVILAAILWCEKEKINPSQSTISTLTSIDKMTLSKALKKIVERKLVAKDKTINDSRSFTVTLSATGKDLVKRAITTVEEIDDDFFNPLGRKNKDTFLSMILDLNKINP